MKFDKPSPFEGMSAPSFGALAAMVFCIILEGTMFTMFYAVYTETIGLMSDTYLSELAVIGDAFAYLDPDANASHIISFLLATFSVGTPIFIWSEIFRQNILNDPQEWFSHPSNQIVASLAGLILLLVIGLEVVNLYTLVARETMPSGYIVQTDDSGLMAYLAQNKGMAIGISAVIAVINIVLALFTTRAIRSLKSTEE
jgi:divalent metal cation (Fe/Co/Zn/Cd) transporter